MTKLFYAVQASRNEHINRARVLAPKLRQAKFDVTYFFSGQVQGDLSDMDVFGDYIRHPGLDLMKEAERFNQPGVDEVIFPELFGFDRVLCDCEPVTASAAKRQNKTVIGIGHQYAFNYRIPWVDDDCFVSRFIGNYAPVDMAIALHWHHFDQPILPPIVDPQCPSGEIDDRKIVVYLPFENQPKVIQLLGRFSEYDFHFFTSNTARLRAKPNVTVHSNSDRELNAHFRNCAGVICDAGFELASRALQAGKKLLVKPSSAQMEQSSNALILKRLEYALIMDELSASILGGWLEFWDPVEIHYPDSAQAVVDWLKDGHRIIDKRWVDSVWAKSGSRSPVPAHPVQAVA